jgi:hypothetical protein
VNQSILAGAYYCKHKVLGLSACDYRQYAFNEIMSLQTLWSNMRRLRTPAFFRQTDASPASDHQQRPAAPVTEHPGIYDTGWRQDPDFQQHRVGIRIYDPKLTSYLTLR